MGTLKATSSLILSSASTGLTEFTEGLAEDNEHSLKAHFQDEKEQKIQEVSMKCTNDVTEDNEDSITDAVWDTALKFIPTVLGNIYIYYYYIILYVIMYFGKIFFVLNNNKILIALGVAGMTLPDNEDDNLDNANINIQSDSIHNLSQVTSRSKSSLPTPNNGLSMVYQISLNSSYLNKTLNNSYSIICMFLSLI